MAVPCMSADVLLWRGQVLLALATASADQISSMLAAQVGCFRRGRYALGGRHWAEAPGMSLRGSDSSCWRSGVAPAGARRDRACVPGGRRDPPGVSREADATAVTLGEFPPGSRGRMLRALPTICPTRAGGVQRWRHADYLFGAGRSAERALAAAGPWCQADRPTRVPELRRQDGWLPGESPRMVGEAEGLLCGFLDGDHEARAVGSAAGEWRVGVLERDRNHVPAVFAGAYFQHPSLDRGHPVRVGHVGD